MNRLNLIKAIKFRNRPEAKAVYLKTLNYMGGEKLLILIEFHDGTHDVCFRNVDGSVVSGSETDNDVVAWEPAVPLIKNYEVEVE